MYKIFRKMKFTSRKVLRTALIFVAILTFSAMILMILNEKSLHDTITDIIVLLVGSIALVMAVLTEAELERSARRSNELHKEVLLALDEIRDINKDNEYIKRKVREEFKIDKEISEKIDKISKEK